MSEATRARLVVVGVAAVALLGLSLALTLLVLQTQEAPSGPVEVIWDREVCAHCGMHIGEPAFAAQLQTRAGDVLNFDDPGCLFEYLVDRRPDVAAIWFRHVREDRWLHGDQTAFVRVEHSPMGYGIGAVEVGEPGSLSLAEARAQATGQPPANGPAED